MSHKVKGRRHIEYINDAGKRHNIDGPAYISPSYTEWWVDGARHRVGRPAVIGLDLEEWWVDGVLHREDGPAISYQGIKQWYFLGNLHRTDGPAYISPSCVKYYYDGVELSKEEWLDFCRDPNKMVKSRCRRLMKTI